MRRKGTSEKEMLPGDSRNLDISIYGVIAGSEYEPLRNLIFRWLKNPDLSKLIAANPFPEDLEKYKAENERLKDDTVKFVSEAIFYNRPEDFKKLAFVLENIFEGVKSPEIREVLLYVWRKQTADSTHRFTVSEIRQVVGFARGIQDKFINEPNEALDKRVDRIIETIGLPVIRRQ